MSLLLRCSTTADRPLLCPTRVGNSPTSPYSSKSVSEIRRRPLLLFRPNSGLRRSAGTRAPAPSRRSVVSAPPLQRSTGCIYAITPRSLTDLSPHLPHALPSGQLKGARAPFFTLSHSFHPSQAPQRALRLPDSVFPGEPSQAPLPCFRSSAPPREPPSPLLCSRPLAPPIELPSVR